MVHPPVAFVPVFALGVAAALSFRATGLLIAPIAAQVTYNAIAITAAALFQ